MKQVKRFSALFLTILHRMEGTPSVKGMDFADVPAGRWYTDTVAWDSANSIVNGGEFHVCEGFGRADFVLSLAR